VPLPRRSLATEPNVIARRCARHYSRGKIMAKYREHFRLSPRDIEIIEDALRAQIAAHARVEAHSASFECARQRTRALNEVLGKLYNQKVFYAQVNDTGVPAA
jgi:hypothetical protein